jgi:hypothetical protein
MGVSETIVAAMIGAIATVTTALFQIFGAFRAKGKVEAKPRRGTALRSTLAVMALMVASAAGGFLYSELLKQRHSEDIRAMRQELRELKDLTAAATRTKEPTSAMAAAPAPPPDTSIRPASFEAEGSVAESVVYVPACRAQIVGAQCQEVDAQRVALCGTIPSYAEVHSLDLFVQPDAVQNPWEQHRVLFEQDLGGARFTGKSFEYAQGEEQKAVCVNFMHWSSEHPHIARLTVQYGFGPGASAPTLDSSFSELEATAMQGPAMQAPTVMGKENAL